MSNPKILVIEDHPLFATGIKELVEFVATNTEIVCAGSVNEGINFFDTTPPNLIITDLRLPDFTGQGVLDKLSQHWPQVPIVIMSGDSQLLSSVSVNHHTMSWQVSKAEGFEQTSTVLLEALTRAGINVQWRPNNTTTRYGTQNGQNSGATSGRSGRNNGIQLTQKQQQVMHYLATGLSNKEIARKLDLSPETIKTHLREIFTRMNVKNRTQAVSLYRKIPRLNGNGPNNDMQKIV